MEGQKERYPAAVSKRDRCLRQIEDILSKTTSDKQRAPDLGRWNEVVEHLQFSEYKEGVITRYWASGIFSDSETAKDSKVEAVIPKKIQEAGYSVLDQQQRIPKAWLDMTDKSNMFSGDAPHRLHKFYGLKDFVVVSLDSDASLEAGHRLLARIIEVACKCESQLPVFVQCSENYYIGFLECPGFRTFFKAWGFKKPSISMSWIYNHFKYNLLLGDYKFLRPVKVSILSYCIGGSSDYPSKEHPHDLTSAKDFVECGDHWCDNNVEFYLNATWSDQLETIVTDCGINEDMDPLDAPEWSVRAKVAETSEVPLGDCLKKFLSLYSSSESLLLNPEISSMLKHGRIYKLTEEANASTHALVEPRKVTSKLLLKPEESLIPAESLNAILDFLFHDAKLQPSQHSNGSSPSTTTTVEDEVEDKFYLSYKESSKYFKEARPNNFLSRLAICLCIVNEYHGGFEAVKQLWGEFVLEMNYRLENNCEIKGLEPVEPKLDYSELLQKLQMLNSHIKKKKVGNASSPITDTSSDEDEKIEEDSLHWLASVQLSDLVMWLTPMLLHLAATTFLKHPVCNLGFLQGQLVQFKNKLFCGGTQSSRIKMLEDHIHQLTFIEQKMATARFLLKKFRNVDPSYMVSDNELEKYVSNLVEFKEVPIKTSKGELPSNTYFGKLIRNLFHDGCKQTTKEGVVKETESGSKAKEIQVNELGPYFMEYNSILDCSKSTGLCLRLHCEFLPEQARLAAAFTDKDQLPLTLD